MDVFRVYVMTKKRDGTVTKSDYITTREQNEFDAVEKAKVYAKSYGFKGKIHIGSVFKKQPDKTFAKI